VAVILSAAIATPVFAHEAVQEPGVQAFYQNLGGRIPIERDGEAMASTRSSSNSSAPVKRVAAKRYTTDHKM
jgi:hypothetical protein